MKPLDLSLYLVLDPDLCHGMANMVETARIAALNGATVVQLRAPHWKKRCWYEAATALKSVLDPLNIPLIINDHVDIALAVDAAGVHVGQADLPVEVARRLIGPTKYLGLSVTSLDDLARAADTPADHFGIGPVYATHTKPDATPPLELSEFSRIVRSAQRPAVAIGGIQPGSCGELITAGSQGVAVVSAICGQADVAAATRALRNEIDTARRV